MSEREVLIWANDQEILLFHLRDGTLLTRLRSPGTINPAGPRSNELGRNRISSIVWRSTGGGRASTGPVMGGGNSTGAIYSAHLDGHIRAWAPQIPGEEEDEDEEDAGEDEEVKKRKRKAVDSAYRSLMGTQITFT
jgi:DNA excision repair protein ERCC-8